MLAADDDEDPGDANLREVLNYVRAAEHAFAWHGDGRPLTVNLLNELHRTLVWTTGADNDQAGRLRGIQVMIGGHPGAQVQESRFVPRPPGPELEHQIRDL